MLKNRLENSNLFLTNEILDLNTLTKEEKDKFLILVGIGEDTRSKAVIDSKDKTTTVDNFFNFEQKKTDGDGTVPLESSSYYKDSVLTLAVTKNLFSNTNFVNGILATFAPYHGIFLNDGRVQTIIKRFLSNQDKNNGYDWWSIIGGSVKKL